jgi:FkbM family methyltransferase
MHEIIYNNNTFRAFKSSSFSHLSREKTKNVFLSLCKKHRLEKFQTYIDCGAAIGVETVQQVSVFEQIHSFEPTKEQFALLSHNIKNYSHCRAYGYALSNYKGSAKLNVYESSYQHSKLPNTGTKDVKQRPSYRVKVSTLDAFDFSNVSFIKIDVEGSERELLLGAIRTLEKSSPILRIEISRSPYDVIKILKDLNYSCIGFDFDGIFYDVENELTFIENDDILYWSSKNTTIDWRLHPREASRNLVFPDGYYPNWGDFWFMKNSGAT